MVATSLLATAIAAGIRIEPAVRMRVLYAFDGALMIPALSPIGAAITAARLYEVIDRLLKGTPRAAPGGPRVPGVPRMPGCPGGSGC